MQDELKAEQERSYEEGLRIYARWIVRAYMRSMAERKAKTSLDIANTSKEEEHANQRYKRDCETTPIGENTARSEERYQ